VTYFIGAMFSLLLLTSHQSLIQ